MALPISLHLGEALSTQCRQQEKTLRTPKEMVQNFEAGTAGWRSSSSQARQSPAVQIHLQQWP